MLGGMINNWKVNKMSKVNNVDDWKPDKDFLEFLIWEHENQIGPGKIFADGVVMDAYQFVDRMEKGESADIRELYERIYDRLKDNERYKNYLKEFKKDK